jgi:hypothetical protein
MMTKGAAIAPTVLLIIAVRIMSGLPRTLAPTTHAIDRNHRRCEGAAQQKQRAHCLGFQGR